MLSEFGRWHVLHIHLNQPRVIVAGCLQKKNTKADQKFLYSLAVYQTLSAIHTLQVLFFLFPKHTLQCWRLVWIKNVCMLAENFNVLKASIKNVWVLVGICNILKLKIKPAFPFTSSGPLDVSSSIRGRLVMTILIFSMTAWHIGFCRPQLQTLVLYLPFQFQYLQLLMPLTMYMVAQIYNNGLKQCEIQPMVRFSYVARKIIAYRLL